ncbi:MAG: EAL domain-containing protein, partial [Oscillospiraceae bacterium]
DLAQKYLHTSKTYFFLTQREKDLIRTLPPLTVAYNPNWIPFEMQNEHGEFSGVIAQAYQRISALTGLRFHFIPTPSDPSVHLDMFTSFEQNFDAASVLGMNLTDAYITLPMVLVRKVGTDAPNKRTATSAKNYSYEGMMSKGYDFVQYDTPEACIAAVKSGEVEQAFVDAVAAESCLRRAPYKGLTRVVLQGQRLNVCAAVSDKLDPLVYNVINKAVLYLSGSEMNDLLISNTFQESKIDFRKMMEQMPMDVFLILFLFCAFLGVSIAFVIRIRSAGKIKAILYYDSLTGLLTKYGFEQRVRETLAKSSKGFFMVDFDVHKFHDFNSLQGRPAGDALLCAIAKKSLENCAADELCARIYADHFMCLVRDQSVEHLIMQITEGSRIFNHADNPLMIGFKYGIYEIKDRSMPVSQMMDRAYVAKQMIDPKSKEFYRVYDDDFYQRQLNESALLLDAESAFRNKEFVAYYQPKFDAKTECVVAAEALVRWRRANGELIFPDRFIELFEKNGKIRELDFYMLREACAYQRQLLDKGISCVPISVNFSGVHFYDADFAGRIDRMVREYRLDKHWIEIEFTETEMIENLGIAEKVFTDLRELGFSIAMDDFGSGYSSLNSLKDIPIDIVKLDRGFFCEPLHRENADLIVAAVIRLAALMKLKTVAEGIETKEQLDFVRDCGCDMIQGYYFSCPIEASAFCAMLTKTEDCTI